MIDEINCHGCDFYDVEDDRCTAFECSGLDCDKPRPCAEVDDERYAESE